MSYVYGYLPQEKSWSDHNKFLAAILFFYRLGSRLHGKMMRTLLKINQYIGLVNLKKIDAMGGR